MSAWDAFWVFVLVAGINLFFKDKQSRRHYRNLYQETLVEEYDSLMIQEVDSLLITTYRK